MLDGGRTTTAGRKADVRGEKIPRGIVWRIQVIASSRVRFRPKHENDLRSLVRAHAVSGAVDAPGHPYALQKSSPAPLTPAPGKPPHPRNLLCRARSPRSVRGRAPLRSAGPTYGAGAAQTEGLGAPVWFRSWSAEGACGPPPYVVAAAVSVRTHLRDGGARGRHMDGVA
ncbi:hypothetical protein BC628DRAFT_1351701 [Trametes gibbosa]|nr:hypothetical protein BC628DRAFT_1351701 [Trametes gibbosa]